MQTSIFTSVNPFTQEVLAEYPVMNDEAVEQHIAKAATAFHEWKNWSFERRAEILRGVATLMRRDQLALATLITREMGKILSESMAEIEKCAGTCVYYADHAGAFLADELMDGGYTRSFVSYEPLGIVLAIMPWNFPFWQVFRYAAPTLMAGNAGLLKHAPNVTGCALAIEKLFREAGAPEGLFKSLVIDTPAVETILSHDHVHAVTLTGSERAGGAVAALAGKNIKKSVMELGGSDAFIVLPDADLSKAVQVALQSRMQNAGQSCIAAKRFIVLDAVMNDFRSELLAGIKKIKQGDPFDPATNMGPMARTDLAQALEKQLASSVSKGAILGTGGIRNGCNFQPSLLLDVVEGMPAFDEETFGPLAAVIHAKDESDAIRLANDSRYGLGGSIWTKDTGKGIHLARQMNTGAVFINTLVKSDPRLPFGGVKKSGYGRDLGRHGILEFVNAKTIAVQA